MSIAFDPPSDNYGASLPGHPSSEPLPEPPIEPASLPFNATSLPAVRRTVAREAARAGLTVDQVSDMVLAVSEVATNSVQHGGGGGLLRHWVDADALVCEVRDSGSIADPLVGRETPGDDPGRARGVWLAYQLCDLVQVSSHPGGQVVRLSMRRQRRD